MPKLMTPAEMDEIIRYLAKQQIDIASRLSSLKVEVQALRETIVENAPTLLPVYDAKFSALMNAFLKHLDSMVEHGKDAAFLLKMRRFLEEFDGPEQ